jgi:hypothetical protein
VRAWQYTSLGAQAATNEHLFLRALLLDLKYFASNIHILVERESSKLQP